MIRRGQRAYGEFGWWVLALVLTLTGLVSVTGVIVAVVSLAVHHGWMFCGWAACIGMTIALLDTLTGGEEATDADR